MAMSTMLGLFPTTTMPTTRLRQARPLNTTIRCSSNDSPRLDRRDVLLGLGGALGTTVAGAARGDPIIPPDLKSCHTARFPDGYNELLPVECCPPYDLSKPLDVKPYVLPNGGPLRVRKAAHKLTKYEQDRFKSAIAEMRKLPSSHPWSFSQQAQIHCAYCNDAYDQKGYNVPLQVHFSWIFPPWHRWYLYFFEKILGKITGDDTIALPYWAYDVEEGMRIPEIYKDAKSSLYNPNRNMSHKNETINLSYLYDVEDLPLPPTVVQDNLALLTTLYDDDSLGYPELFMGDRAVAGELVTGARALIASGRLETVHNFVHMWSGKVEAPNYDMGTFSTAAKDPIFYGHHANVDRLWHLYQVKRKHAVEFNEAEWLNATFIFYDENQKIVSVNVRDSLNSAAMGVTYEDIPLKYMTMPKGNTKAPPAGAASDFGSKPRPLDSKIVTTLKRPKASRTAAEKAGKAEVLIIDGIEFKSPDAAGFDVYLSNSKQSKAELVGTFSRVRHTHVHGNASDRVCYKVGITGAVERVGADVDDTVVVTLVPRTGNLVVSGAHIELANKRPF